MFERLDPQQTQENAAQMIDAMHWAKDSIDRIMFTPKAPLARLRRLKQSQPGRGGSHWSQSIQLEAPRPVQIERDVAANVITAAMIFITMQAMYVLLKSALIIFLTD